MLVNQGGEQMEKPAKDIKQFPLRLDANLYRMISKIAISEHRSLNAEITRALERIYLKKGEN